MAETGSAGAKGLASAAKEASVLSRMRRAAGRVWDEFEPVVAHGAHEAASMLYTGSTFVMYPHAGREQDRDPSGLAGMRAAAEEKSPQAEPERDGRGREDGRER